MENRRIGMGPIPPVPKDYLTEQQVTKLAILKKVWLDTRLHSTSCK